MNVLSFTFNTFHNSQKCRGGRLRMLKLHSVGLSALHVIKRSLRRRLFLSLF